MKRSFRKKQKNLNCIYMQDVHLRRGDGAYVVIIIVLAVILGGLVLGYYLNLARPAGN